VAHAMEMPYIFDSFDRDPFDPLYSGRQARDARSLLKVMQGYWTNFARTGDPNGPGLPGWPKFTTADPQVQVFNTETGPTSAAPLGERCAVWEEIGHTPSWR